MKLTTLICVLNVFDQVSIVIDGFVDKDQFGIRGLRFRLIDKKRFQQRSRIRIRLRFDQFSVRPKSNHVVGLVFPSYFLRKPTIP